MKSRDLQYLRSDTQDSIGIHSRAQSYQSSILIKDLDSRCFSIIQHKPPALSLMGKQLNYGVLTENTEEEWGEKVRRLEMDNRGVKEKMFEMEDMMREQKDSYEAKIRLKEIAEAEYISGMSSMYERNTHLSQQIIIYEKELKAALYKVCQLERELSETASKSKVRVNRQMELELKVKEIEEKYHEKIMSLEKSYESERGEKSNEMREWRFQVESMKERLQKERYMKRELEVANEALSKVVADKESRLQRLGTVEVENNNLMQEVRSLKAEILRVQKESVKEKESHRERERVEKQPHTQSLASSTIAALAIENITLKQEQAESAKTLFILSDKVKSYQTQLYSRSIDKENQYVQRSQHRQSYRKERFSSVGRQNTSAHTNLLPQPSLEYMTGNSFSAKPKYRQSTLLDQKRRPGYDSFNSILVRKCKDLNQSLYI